MSSNPKRHRTPSYNSSSSTSTTETLHPNKASRIVPPVGRSGSDSVTHHPLVCTLPPTCNHRPTPLANSRDMETHYATYHAHVCEQDGCGAVFPEARFLELHQNECHDPLAAVRKDRGEKIFACLLASCPRLFSKPKTRRLHLIQAHGYPKEFFFSVTNKGIGGLLKRWGEGASMVRGEWKARGDTKKIEQGGEDDEDEVDEVEVVEEEESNEGQHQVIKEEEADLDDSHSTGREENKDKDKDNEVKSMSIDEALDALADNMDALTLVPPSIRFGRGGKKGGFLQNVGGRGGHLFDRGGDFGGRRGRGRGGRGRGRGVLHQPIGAMNVDVEPAPGPHFPPLGRAGRGRARGSFRARRARDDFVG